MRKIMTVMAVVLVLIFGFAVARSMAQEMMEKSGGSSEPVGAAVRNLKGEDLGTVTDVVMGPEGRVAFAILTYWVSDDTQRRIAVPFGALSCQEQKCVLNASRDKLASEPAYGSEDELNEPKVAGDIYRYFGIQPYWTGEGTEK
jgi:hypothetical protein